MHDVDCDYATRLLDVIEDDRLGFDGVRCTCKTPTERQTEQKPKEPVQ